MQADTETILEAPMADDKKSDMPFDPAGLIENAFLMGIGVLDISREKAEGFAAELIERGKMSQSDAKKVADRVSEMAGTQQEAVRRTVENETARVWKTSGVATKGEVADLKAQIAELKAMLVSQGAAVPEPDVANEVADTSQPDE
jgi:polyhydroxyalkanoate synthesis regulator phasin